MMPPQAAHRIATLCLHDKITPTVPKTTTPAE